MRERLTAIVLFVSSFAQPLPPGELVGDFDHYDHFEDLTGADTVAGAIAAQLATIGYSVTTHGEPTAEELGKFVENLINSGDETDLRIVYVISHASVSASIDKLHIVGRSGTVDPSTIVERWLEAVEFSRRPRTLFVLDTCYAGKAASVPWEDKRSGVEPRAVVLAASAWDSRAYEFRLTKALAALLADSDALDAFPSLPHLKWDLVARTLRDRVAMLGVDSGYAQYPASTLVDPAIVDFDNFAPFFPNPRYQEPSATEVAREAAPDGLAPFVDGVDVGHFLTRALAHDHTDLSPGLFRGRAEQLTALSEWLNEGSPNDRLRIVVGDPGAGKSALLGVLVCTMMPSLRDSTERAWRHLPVVPNVVRDAAAVHARGRGLNEVVHSIAEQLGLSAAIDKHIEHRNIVTALVDAIAAMPRTATITLDALDESPAAAQITSWLLIPLLTDRRGKQPACRILIGTRSGGNWPAADPLLDIVLPGQLIDLSAVSTHTLRADLEAYFRDALSASDRWGPAHPEITERVSERVATTLSLSHHAEGWGEFLVGGLLIDHLVRVAVPDDPDSIEAALSQIPVTLPQVLELQLANERDDRSRQLLTAFALAKGEGMPLSLASRLAATIGGNDEWASSVTVQVRDQILFYLRVVPDVDGTSLYRPFHEGIARYLAGETRAEWRSRVLDVIISTRRLGGELHWEDASPYLQRHLLEHAGDAGRTEELLRDPEVLVFAEPSAVYSGIQSQNRALDGPPALYNFLRLAGKTPPQRRDLLTLAAVETGDHLLSAALRGRRRGRGSWAPTWSVLGTTARVIDTQTKREDWITAAGYLEAAGSAHIVTGHESGLMRVWRPPSRELFGGTTERGSPVWSLTLASANGTPCAVVGSLSGGASIWDLATASKVAEIDTGRVPIVQMSSLSSGPDLRIFGVTVDGKAFVWNWRTGFLEWIARGDIPFSAIAAGFANGRPLVLAGNNTGVLRIMQLPASDAIHEAALSNDGSRITAIALGSSGGSSWAVVGDATGYVHVWDLARAEEVGTSQVSQRGAVGGLTATTVDGQPVVLSGGEDGTVRTLRLPNLQPHAFPLTTIGPITELATPRSVGNRVVVRSGGKLAEYEWSPQ